MRVGLIAALKRDAEGNLRAALPLAGRSVLAWQGALLQVLGAERVVCLTEGATPDILALQHSIEGSGAAFHALTGFAALPALVRAEDDLVIITDGLVPDTGIVRAVLGAGKDGGAGGLQRAVAAIPADHPLAAAHPDDFERIDAARHWAGVLAMRGAPVQQLADFPADADAVSLLLRLALQSGTPVRDLAAREPLPERWLLADSAARVKAAEQAMVAGAAGAADPRAPMVMLARMLVRIMLLRGVSQGGLVAGGIGLMLLLAGVMTAAFGPAAVGLVLGGLGAFALRVAEDHGLLAARLRGQGDDAQSGAGKALTGAGEWLAALLLWFALAPWPGWQPLAVLGPVTVGLARLAVQNAGDAMAAAASDRAAWLLLLGVAAALGAYPEALACLALGLLAALLLRGRAT